MSTYPHRRRRRRPSQRRSTTQPSQPTTSPLSAPPPTVICISEGPAARPGLGTQAPRQDPNSREYLRDYRYITGELARILIIVSLLLVGLIIAALILR